MVAVNDRYDGAASPLEMGRQTRCDTGRDGRQLKLLEQLRGWPGMATAKIRRCSMGAVVKWCSLGLG